MSQATCNMPDCTKPVHQDGLCAYHNGQAPFDEKVASHRNSRASLGRLDGRRRAPAAAGGDEVDMAGLTCRVPGCGRKGLKRGLCNRHYILLHEPGQAGDIARAAALPSRQGQGGGRKKAASERPGSSAMDKTSGMVPGPRRGRVPNMPNPPPPPPRRPGKTADVLQMIWLLADRLGLEHFRQDDRVVVICEGRLASVNAAGEVRRCEVRELTDK